MITVFGYRGDGPFRRQSNRHPAFARGLDVDLLVTDAAVLYQPQLWRHRQMFSGELHRDNEIGHRQFSSQLG